MATLPGERTGLLAPRKYEEEGMTNLGARANASQACSVDQHKKDMAWTCSSSAALIILVALSSYPCVCSSVNKRRDEDGVFHFYMTDFLDTCKLWILALIGAITAHKRDQVSTNII